MYIFGTYIIWTFGLVYGILVYFFCFGMVYQENSGNPVAELKIGFKRISEAVNVPKITRY
jgi:hypothetical protein